MLKETDDFYVYYKEDEEQSTFRVLNNKTNRIQTLKYEEFSQLKHKYYMITGYEASDEGLTSYICDFKRWVEEFSHNPVLDIKVLKYIDLPGMLFCKTFNGFF